MSDVFSNKEGLKAIQVCTRKLREKGWIEGKRSRIVAESGFLSLSEDARIKFKADFDLIVGLRCMGCGEFFNAKDLRKVVADTFCSPCTADLLAHDLLKLKEENDELKEENVELRRRVGEHPNWKHAIGWKNKFSAFRNIHDSQLGKMLSKKSKELGISKDFAEHQKYNKVGVYHKSVAEALAKELLRKKSNGRGKN